jgi:hypothetical protein
MIMSAKAQAVETAKMLLLCCSCRPSHSPAGHHRPQDTSKTLMIRLLFVKLHGKLVPQSSRPILHERSKPKHHCQTPFERSQLRHDDDTANRGGGNRKSNASSCHFYASSSSSVSTKVIVTPSAGTLRLTESKPELLAPLELSRLVRMLGRSRATTLDAGGRLAPVETEESALASRVLMCSAVLLTSGDARADVHGGDLGPARDAGGRGLKTALLGATAGSDGNLAATGGGNDGSGRGRTLLSALGLATAGAGGGNLIVVDDDADAGALGASSELDLGTLDESGLGVAKGAVEAGNVTLGDGSGGLVSIFLVFLVLNILRRSGDLDAGLDLLAVAAQDAGDVVGLTGSISDGCLYFLAGQKATYLLLVLVLRVGGDDDGGLLGLGRRRGVLVVLGDGGGGVDGGALEGGHERVDVGLASERNLAITDHQGGRVGSEVDIKGHGADPGDQAGKGDNVGDECGEHLGGWYVQEDVWWKWRGLLGRKDDYV